MSKELVRLDKALADGGLSTRSQVRRQILDGQVTVNGTTAHDPGQKVCRETDLILVRGAAAALQKHCYLMLNKPAGVVSATEDAHQPTVIDLVPPELARKGLFPAGRLDKDTTGMMLLTDDGDFAHLILAPKSHIPKTYVATLDIPVTAAMADDFNAGIQLKDEKKCMPAQLEILTSHTAKVTISEGMYHQIKRMFGCHGAKVVLLHRVAMGALPLDPTLAPGSCRELTPAELVLLQKTGKIAQGFAPVNPI